MAQAFKFLGDTRDPLIRAVALEQLAETVSKRAKHLDPTNRSDLAEFLNTTAHPGEGRAGDLHSLWSSAWGQPGGGRSCPSHRKPLYHLAAAEAGLPGDERSCWGTCFPMLARVDQNLELRMYKVYPFDKRGVCEGDF